MFVRSRLVVWLRQVIVTSLIDLRKGPCGQRGPQVVLAQCPKFRSYPSGLLKLLLVEVGLVLLCKDREEDCDTVLPQAAESPVPAGSALPLPRYAFLE